jgi:hypothetical protein
MMERKEKPQSFQNYRSEVHGLLYYIIKKKKPLQTPVPIEQNMFILSSGINILFDPVRAMQFVPEIRTRIGDDFFRILEMVIDRFDVQVPIYAES